MFLTGTKVKNFLLLILKYWAENTLHTIIFSVYISILMAISILTLTYLYSLKPAGIHSGGTLPMLLVLCGT